MKYQVGQKIKYVNKDYWFLKNHYGAVGIVVDYRRYCEKYPTHYVVKWDCYTIPHIYNRCDIEKCCEPVGEVAAEDVQTIDNVVKVRKSAVPGKTMNEEEIRQYLKKNLRIYADLDDRSNPKMHTITLTLGHEVINETKLWL